VFYIGTNKQQSDRDEASLTAKDGALHLLNCANGVVDLRTGTMMPHDRKSVLSKIN